MLEKICFLESEAKLVHLIISRGRLALRDYEAVDDPCCTARDLCIACSKHAVYVDDQVPDVIGVMCGIEGAD